MQRQWPEKAAVTGFRPAGSCGQGRRTPPSGPERLRGAGRATGPLLLACGLILSCVAASLAAADAGDGGGAPAPA
ncbi:MAG: hypothetical protein ACREJ2_17965, partial [Planctomycetota bacterium]